MTKKKKSKMPDLGFRRTEFDGRHDIQKGKEFFGDIRNMLERLLSLPLIRHQTQREEMVRSFMFNIQSRDISRLPYWSNGIGSTEEDKFKALMAEVSCLICAYWDWLNEPSDPKQETIGDHMEYLDHVCRDPDTLKVTELKHGHGKSGSCRYRITNDRIMNGMKMMEF